jgi:hypothetical protein
MALDLVATLELTIAASILIAAFSIAFGATIARRIRLAAVLLAWFALVATLATTQAVSGPSRLPALGLVILLPVVVLAFTVLKAPSLRERLERIPLTLLVGVNVVRILGVMFLLLHAAGRLPAPFAPVAGWGDILVGVLAVPVAWLVHTRGRAARGVVLAWNTLGMADLIAAIGLGVLSSPGRLQLIHTESSSTIMTTLPWLLIPAFLVPILFASHLAIFHRLRAARSAGTISPTPA